MNTTLPEGLAEENCVQYGGHLVSILNDDEVQFILRFVDWPILALLSSNDLITIHARGIEKNIFYNFSDIK